VMDRWDAAAAATWNRHLSALISSTAWAGRQEILATSPVRRQERRKPARRGDRSIPRSRPDKLSESEDGTIIVIISPSSSRRAALNVAEALGASIRDAAAAPSRAPAVSTTGRVVDNHRPLHRPAVPRPRGRPRPGRGVSQTKVFERLARRPGRASRARAGCPRLEPRAATPQKSHGRNGTMR
jgi:hypothetical protein